MALGRGGNRDAQTQSREQERTQTSRQGHVKEAANTHREEKRHDNEVIALVSEQNAENNLESDVNTPPDIAKLIQKGRTNAKRKSTVISHWAKYDAQTG
jgi:heat shock protein HspQ